MKKWIALFALLPGTLCALPYYTEYRAWDRLIIFHGNISEKDQAQVKVLERKFMDEVPLQGDIRAQKWNYKTKLKKLGVTVEVIPDYGFYHLTPFESNPLKTDSTTPEEK